MLQLCAALAVFVGGHILISRTGLRQRATDAIGEIAYLALFTLFAASSMLWVSFRAAPWQEVWLPLLGLRWLSVAFIAIALWLLVDGLVARLRARPTLPPPIAAYAVTRQPIMVAIVLWGGAHMLVRGDAATVPLFGGFAVLGVAGALSQDRKARAYHNEAWPAYAATTSLAPLLALISGRARLSPGDIGWWPGIVSLALLLAMLWLHPLIFGLSPLP
ncbi:MAG TPA: NnrU family protein [Alphaproteobacteria bacterium]|jgi:uncharacterized membrane protein|nr:NnrU family protein [Alphaproteobacteria bacterium]